MEKQSNTKARYKLAKASDRVLSRIVDLIIVGLVNLGLAALIFLTDPAFSGSLSGFIVSQPFRYLLFGLTSFISFFSYFVILPYYWKGQTLGLKLFKLGIYNQLLSGFFFNLVKKEVFIWMMTLSIGIILSIVLFVIGIAQDAKAANDIILSLIHAKKPEGGYTWIIVTFSSFYTLSALILLLALINTIIRSEKRTIIDNWSNTVTVKLKDISSNKDNHNLNKIKTTKNKNYSLPGIILDNPNEEIKSLED